DPPRLNIPVVLGSGLHTDPTWKPNEDVDATQDADLMVPAIPTGVRRAISLYPNASLNARGSAYVIPMQYVDTAASGTQNGSAGNPWQSMSNACDSSPSGTPLLLANEEFHVTAPSVFCANASAHVVYAARGGATLGAP